MIDKDIKKYLRLGMLAKINEKMGTKFKCINDLVDYAKNLEKEHDLLQQKWLESEYEKSKLVSQIEKMKCCGNCKHCDSDNPCRFHRENRQCDNYGFWELAE